MWWMAESTAPRYEDVITEAVLPLERRRITALNEMFNPHSTRLLGGLGLRPGLRCLDAGAGPGILTSWLAAQVAPAQVLALDIELGTLTEDVHPAVRPQLADLTDPAAAELLPPGSLDLVHARFLLQHLPEPERILRVFHTWLAPGGVLLISDSWFPPLHGSMPAELIAAHRAVQTIGRRHGADWSWAERMPGALARLGLTGLGAEVSAPPLTAGSSHATMLSLLITLLRPRMLAEGLITESELDLALSSLDSPELVAAPYLMVSAWGRKA